MPSPQSTDSTPHVLLIGGGPAHAQFLLHARKELPEGVHITLVTPERFVPHPGMIAGFVSGDYRYRDCHIDLARLCADASATLVYGRVERLDLNAQRALTAAGQSLRFDYLSINCGVRPSTLPQGTAEHAICFKPTGDFLPQWQQLQERLRQRNHGAAIGVIGSSAMAVELALALRLALQRDERLRVPVEVHLIHQGKQVPEEAPEQAQTLLSQLLNRAQIRVHPRFKVASIEPGKVISDHQQMQRLDEVIWCTDTGAPSWPAAAGLAVDEQGFIQVNHHLQSVSHTRVFAAGRIARTSDQRLYPHTIQHARRQAHLLIHNLKAALSGQSLRRHNPNRHLVEILGCGDEQALLRYGNRTWVNKWAWRWKKRRDKKWVGQFPGY